MLPAYLDAIALSERLHRRFLEIIRVELENAGRHDINNVQAMMLFNVGDQNMTISELSLRGCYLGSNVSYNVKKLAEYGYLSQQRSQHDRRSIRVSLTDKGMAVRNLVMTSVEKQLALLGANSIDEPALAKALAAFHRLDRFWAQSLSVGTHLAHRSSAA